MREVCFCEETHFSFFMRFLILRVCRLFQAAAQEFGENSGVVVKGVL